MSVNEQLNVLAVGFEDGSLSLFRGDLTKERGSLKVKVVANYDLRITGLSFKRNILFVATESNVSTLDVNVASSKPRELDDVGCESGLFVECESNSVIANVDLLTARSDAVYCYNDEVGR